MVDEASPTGPGTPPPGHNTPIVIDEAHNPYRDCIQGLANEPITVVRLLRDAVEALPPGSPLTRLETVTLPEVVSRLVANRPRVAIIAGSPDHPAHLLDRAHALMAAARVWQNGGVPFHFSVPVICDGTAQSNIGQSYSLASRNHTSAAVNINFEGHSYHAAYVLAGCDKSPSAIIAALAAAEVARRARGNQAPVWAVFAPEHVLRGGTVPEGTRRALLDVAEAADAAGHHDLGADLRETLRYILQCSSDEAFAGQLERAVNLDLIKPVAKRRLLDQLAAATCHEDGGICAFNGTGNSSRTMMAALGLTPPELELLTGLPPQEGVAKGIDGLFALFNKPEYSVVSLLAANFANVVRMHGATGSSSNMLLHLPSIMRHAGFDVTIDTYRAIRDATPVPEVFAHSLTEGRDTFALARQFAQGANRGMESLYAVLARLGVPLDLDAPTVTGGTWAARIADLRDHPVDESLGESAVIRARPIRTRSGVEVLDGSFFESCVVKISGLSDDQIAHFDGRVLLVRHYENEHACSADFAAADLMERLRRTESLDAALLGAAVAANGGAAAQGRQAAEDPALFGDLVGQGLLAFAFVIAGQGPLAYGMPEMFAPSQNLRHHRLLEASSILVTDGRYSGVTKGPCLGHMVPEAYQGGGIGYLRDGDALRLDLSAGRLDLLAPAAFRAGRLEPMDPHTDAGRTALFTERWDRMEARRLEIAACNVMDGVSDASRGVVPMAVDRRAKRPYPVPKATKT